MQRRQQYELQQQRNGIRQQTRYQLAAMCGQRFRIADRQTRQRCPAAPEWPLHQHTHMHRQHMQQWHYAIPLRLIACGIRGAQGATTLYDLCLQIGACYRCHKDEQLAERYVGALHLPLCYVRHDLHGVTHGLGQLSGLLRREREKRRDIRED